MARKIFISYRRRDRPQDALLIYKYLQAELGVTQVFMDEDGIQPGQDFVEVLERELNDCIVLLALIGPSWLKKDKWFGKPKLSDKNDFVRIEIGTALNRKLLVVPLLLGGAKMPSIQDLPEDLHALLKRQGIEVDLNASAAFHRAMKSLVEVVVAALEAEDVNASQYNETSEGDAVNRAATTQAEEKNEGAIYQFTRLDAVRKEAARKEAERQEVARREATKKEAAKKEAAKKEAERKEVALREAAIRQAAKLEAIPREAAKRGVDAERPIPPMYSPSALKATQVGNNPLLAAWLNTRMDKRIFLIDGKSGVLVDPFGAHVRSHFADLPDPRSVKFYSSIDGKVEGHPNCIDGHDGFGAWRDIRLGRAIQRFRWISSGSFWMGSDESEHVHISSEEGRAYERWLLLERPRRHIVVTEGFWLADTVCTQEFWNTIVGRNPSYFKGEKNLPVEQVSWMEIVNEFIPALSDRYKGPTFFLPSEAQWEFACRAESDSAYSHENIADQINAHYSILGFDKFFAKELNKKTVNVSSYHPNKWGLFQMHGNVWEWCQDWVGSYDEREVKDPRGPIDGMSKIVRGGSWADGVVHCRSAQRLGYIPSHKSSNIGFRLAMK
jgi:formylglycine-generating enzyme required for sulfatase activity